MSIDYLRIKKGITFFSTSKVERIRKDRRRVPTRGRVRPPRNLEGDRRGKLGSKVPNTKQRTRTSSETRHRLHVSEDGVEETGTGRETDFTDGYGESSRNVLELRVVREGVLRLRHANCRQSRSASTTTRGDRKSSLTGKVSVALTGVGVDLLLRELAELDAVGTIDLLRNDFDLLLNWLL